MSVRTVIILLALPLFLFLAGINSALLYRQETSHMEAGLRGEALAAAVTVAEFARQADDPFAELGETGRRAALRDAAHKIPGLVSLYLVRPGGPLLNLLDTPAVARKGLVLPARAHVVRDWVDAEGDPLVTAIAPDGHGAMVVAEISAEPLARRAFHLKRLSAALIAGSAALAVLLGLIVARRVGRAFNRTRAIIETRAGADDDRALGIREVRDLADAIGLLDKSVASELERLAQRPGGGLADGIAALRERHLPGIERTEGGVALSIRPLPEAPAGAVHVALPCPDGGWAIALGVADGEPAEALAAAIAARDHVAAGPASAFRDRLELAAQAFGIDWRVIATDATDGAFALAADAAAIDAYRRLNPGLSAEALAADLAILFAESGIVAAVRPV
ncbi:hypothetical protein [Sphingomonas sp. YL-JM2C]